MDYLSGEKLLKIGAPKEIFEGEARVAMTPDSAKLLQKLGHTCVIETGAGLRAGFSDKAYADAGVEVVKTAAALFKAADVIVKVRGPEPAHSFYGTLRAGRPGHAVAGCL